MPLNLIKLSVGSESLEGLQDWVDRRSRERRARGEALEHIHTTRMVPRRRDELLDAGSIYWVIKGQIQGRQVLTDIQPFTDSEGIGRCDLVMAPELIATEWAPRRPFQGWRYLKASEAPSDLQSLGEGAAQLPADMRRELADLGLL